MSRIPKGNYLHVLDRRRGMGVRGEGLDESREGNNPWILHRREMGFQGEKGNAYRLFPWQPTEEAE